MTVRKAILGGAGVIQLRDKNASDAELIKMARQLLTLTRSANIPLIINDRIEVAKKSGADGVHLGQTDAGLQEAREALGKNAIIGRSTHTQEQALAAQKEGFDYIGIGPVFGTPTKPLYQPVGLDLVRFAAANIHIPFVAIGGIDAANAASVKQAGASVIAVVRAIMDSDDPAVAAQTLLGIMS